MYTPDDEKVREYTRLIGAAAYKFRNAAEYDDLYQEGMIAVWKCPPDATPSYIHQSIYLRMKDWVRFVKRMRHFQPVDYEYIMEYRDRMEDPYTDYLYDSPIKVYFDDVSKTDD